MKNTRKIAANFVLKVSADVYSRIGMLILIVVIARLYGAESFGKYAVSFSLANLFYIVTEFGLHTILIRDIGSDNRQAQTYWGQFLFLKIITSLLALGGIAAAGIIISLPVDTARILMLAAVWMIANSMIDGINSLFTAFEKLQYVVYNTFFYRTVLYAVGFTALILHVSLWGICLIIALSSVLGMISGFWILYRFVTAYRIQFDLSFIKKRLRDAWPIALSGIFISMYLRIDTVILSKWKGDLQTGIYHSAFKIYETLAFIPSIFQSIVLPSFSRYFAADREKLKAACGRGMVFMFLIGFPLSILFFIKADLIISLLYGSSYASSHTVLKLLSPAVCFLFLNAVPGIILIAAHKQKINAYASFSAMIVNIISNIVLIPRWGFVGCSLSVVLTQCTMFIILMYGSWRWIVSRQLCINFAKICASGAVMALVYMLCGGLPQYIVIPGGFILFYGTVIVTGVVTVREIQDIVMPLLRKNS